jgi:4-hydroxybenzoate polyprenyltransferase
MLTQEMNTVTGSGIPYSIPSRKFASAYIITMRPYLLFVSGITGIAGISFSYIDNLFVSFILFISFFLSYGFGQALTDCFQTDTDSLSSPYRPLVQGLIRKTDALIVSLTGLFAVGIAISVNNLINIPLTLLAVLGLATYTPFKRKWWGGPFYNSWIVALLFIIAFLSGGTSNIIDTQNLPFIFALCAVFFGYANFVLTGYYKDISADSVTGYNTLPVKFGLRLSSYVSDIFAVFIVSGTCLSIYYLTDKFVNIPFTVYIFFIPGLVLAVYSQIWLHKIRSEKEAHRSIVPVVHTYILLLSSIAVLNKPGWFIPLILFYTGFIAVMKLRPYQQQI